LYELLCLRLPFDGKNMQQLAFNVTKQSPLPLPGLYSEDIKSLTMAMLSKSSKIRPSISSILSRPVVKHRISDFLNEAHMAGEFNHTVIHGLNILREEPSRAEALAQAAMVPAPKPKVPAQVLEPVNEQHLLQQQRERLLALQKQRKQMLENLAQPIKRELIPDIYDQIARFKNIGKPAADRAEAVKPVEPFLFAAKEKVRQPVVIASNPKSHVAEKPAPWKGEVAVPQPSAAAAGRKVNVKPPIPKQMPKAISPQNHTPSKSPTPAACQASSRHVDTNGAKPAANPFAKIINPTPSPTHNLPSTPNSHITPVKAHSPFTPDSLNARRPVIPVPAQPRPNFELKDNWLSNLETQLHAVKQQMEQLKQADFPSPAKAVSPSLGEAPVKPKKIQVIVSHSPSDVSDSSGDPDNKARIVIKGVDKSWLSNLEGQMGDLKQQMKHLNIESRRSPSPRMQRLPISTPPDNSSPQKISSSDTSTSTEHSPTAAAVVAAAPVARAVKDLSPAERVKWYTELEGKMNDLMYQMEEIKKAAPAKANPQEKATNIHTPEKLSPVNNLIVKPQAGKQQRSPAARLASHAQKSPNAVIKSPQSSAMKAKPSPSSSRRPSAFSKPSVDVVVGKALVPKLGSHHAPEINTVESKERLEARKQNRNFERADFKEFLRAQRSKVRLLLLLLISNASLMSSYLRQRISMRPSNAILLPAIRFQSELLVRAREAMVTLPRQHRNLHYHISILRKNHRMNLVRMLWIL
jgi:hypothetical protein